MTKEQYEKLKEWIEAKSTYAMVKTQHCSEKAKELEKELDNLMEESFKAQELIAGTWRY